VTATQAGPAPAATEAWRDAANRDIAVLRDHAGEWARLPIRRRIELLEGLRDRTAAIAPRWVALALAAKGLRPDAPAAGEEWTAGPWALLFALNRLRETLLSLEKHGRVRLRGGSVRTREGGQVVVDVFPQSTYDRLLLSGVSAEVWMQPGVTVANLAENMAAFYRQDRPEGAVALVLGAGNVASIAPLDVLHKLYAEGQVCLLKMNPVNDYLGPVFEEVFAELVAAGWLRTVYGGPEVGAFLVAHQGIDEIHMTGSDRTHDAIVFGAGPDGEERKRSGRPLIAKRITSELGNVSPTIVVPGPWDDADLRFQAAHIATQKLHNGGFNCIAAQVLVLPGGWEPGPRLLDQVAAVMAAQPARPAYYPGAAERRRRLAERHPDALVLEAGDAARTLIAGLDSADAGEVCYSTEAFASVLAATTIAAPDPATFLMDAVDFANTRLSGTLGANIIVHPATIRELGPRLEEAIARLRYGCVGVNVWTGVGYLLAQTPWGAFPGHTLENIGSGIGFVHNTLLFDRPQKSVVRAPFYPFPRGVRHGQVAMLPHPPWFVTNPRADQIGRRLVEFEADPSPLRLPGIFAQALRA
jgi:aldehyde dehydrogenase (NAD(P)+)